MSLTLFHSPASPFVRCVQIAIEELGLRDEVALTPIVTTVIAPDAALIPANPLGKIPALARPDGPTLYDSRVIMRYLDSRAQGRLYPQSGIWEVLTLEALAHGAMDAAVLAVYERRFRTAKAQNAEWLAGQLAKVTRALDAIEGQWLSHLSGPLTAAQIGVGAALGYLDFRHPDLAWRDGRASLAEWFAKFCERPSMVATAPPEA